MCTATPELSGLAIWTVSTTSQRLIINDLSPNVSYTVRCTSRSISTGPGSGSLIHSCSSTMNTIRMPESGKYTFLKSLCTISSVYYLAVFAMGVIE